MARLVLTLLLASPMAAAAQAPVGSLAALQKRLKTGASIVLTDREGREVKGTVTTLSPDSLEIRNKRGPIRFGEADIALIERRRTDTILDGVAIGAAAGAGSILAVGLFLCDDDCDFGGDAAEILGMYGLIGGAIGLIVDASIRGLHPIYIGGLRSPTKPTLAVSPLVARRGGGAALSLRF